MGQLNKVAASVVTMDWPGSKSEELEKSQSHYQFGLRAQCAKKLGFLLHKDIFSAYG